MDKRVDRPGVRAGYERWAASHDRTPNPLVALDRCGIGFGGGAGVRVWQILSVSWRQRDPTDSKVFDRHCKDLVELIGKGRC